MAIRAARAGLAILTIAALSGGLRAQQPSTATQAPATGRYVITAVPLDVGSKPQALCIAVDPSDAHGVWWWEPGRSGCATRSTGPLTFPGGHATVEAPTASGAIHASFQLALHRAAYSTEPAYLEVPLVIEHAVMRSTRTGAEVATVRRKDLEIPHDCC